MKSTNLFRRLRELGYLNVLPIIPPHSEIYANSYLAAKVGTPQDARGKAPGIIWASGRWGGLQGWETIVADDALIDHWFSLGAGVGMRTGEDVLVIDIDARDLTIADEIEADAVARFGPAPMRVGQWPKRALVYRIDGSLPYETITYQRAGQDNVPVGDRENDAIEFSAGGRQMVMFGRHPKTGKDYEWPRPLVPFDQLSFVPHDALAQFKADWLASLPKAVRSNSRRHDEAPPEQESLKGALPLVAKAMRALPNSRALYPTYNDMIRVGEALHAATADDRSLGLELWHEWCAKWEGGDYREEETDRVWKTFDHDHFIGAGYIFGQAHKYSAESNGVREFDIGEVWFVPVPDDPGPNGLLAIDDLIVPSTIKPRNYVIYPFLQIGDVAQIVGEPGVSKSTLMLMIALMIAADREDLLVGNDRQFGPERLHLPGPCIIYNGEDRLEEMKRRMVVLQQRFSIAKMKHPVFLWSGVDGDALKLMERKTTNAPLTRAASANMLENLVRQTGAVFVGLDPQVSLMGGGHENDADDMDALFSELARMATRLGIAVATNHHSSKATRNDAGNMAMGRGSFAQAGKVRSQMTLTNVSAEEAEQWGLPSTDNLIQLAYGKVSYGEVPRLGKILRRLSRPVGNGVGLADAEAGFIGYDREHARQMGDYAPVLEVVGLTRTERVDGENQADGARAAEKERRRGVAHAVASAMAMSSECALGDIRPAITKALHDAGVTTATTRQVVVDLVTSSLSGGGEIVEYEGRTVRVRAEKRGHGSTAPWFIVKTPEQLAGLAGLAGEGVLA